MGEEKILQIIPAQGYTTCVIEKDKNPVEFTNVIAFALVEIENDRVVLPVGPDGNISYTDDMDYSPHSFEEAKALLKDEIKVLSFLMYKHEFVNKYVGAK